jgi:uncharacterized protein YbjT (DUF2867 family)
VKRTLVTAASGNVGSQVVCALLKTDVQIVAADRQPERARALFGDGVKSVAMDFLPREAWPAALEGVTQLFSLRPPAIADVENNLNPFVDAARARGVDHVVVLSVAGAERSKLVPHRKVEDLLRSRGDHRTDLRPGFFAQILDSAHRDDVVLDD